MNSYNGYTPAERIRALHWLQREYAIGRRKPPTVCDVCGQNLGVIEAHSENYSAPYGDNIGRFGLCYICHIMLHCRFRNPVAWERYKTATENGARFQPFYSRDFIAFKRLYLQSQVLPHPMLTLPVHFLGAWDFLKIKDAQWKMFEDTDEK